MDVFDLIIIGGGPTGLNCAISALRRDMRVLVLEKGLLVNSIYRFPTNMTFFSTSRLLEIAGTPFISHGDKPTRTEALEYYRRLQESFHIPVNLYEEVQSMTPAGSGLYRINTRKAAYFARSVIVATGFYDTPRKLEIPGEELPKVKHYYDDAHPYIGQNLLVIGAAHSACDVALETWQKGAKVTMAIRENEIYPRVKYWIRPNIENRIKEGSIKAYFNTVVREIRPDEAVLEGPEGIVTLPNDFVLAMTGYKPDYALLNSLGLEISGDGHQVPLHDPETLETHLPNVFIAGVVCAGLKTSTLFIENTREHSEIILTQLAERLGIKK